MKTIVSLLTMAISPFVLISAACSATELWSTEGFSNPESVLYDIARDVIYVSNINGEATGKDGVGYISRMGKDGKIQDLEWVTGLNAPKALVQFDNLLYVSDIDQLVSIDVESGTIVDTWDADGAKFLNDLAVDEKGHIDVSDMITNSIYKLTEDGLSLWLQDEGLQHPNGLQVDGDQLLIAPWGKELQEDFSTKVPGYLISVDLASKSISTVGSGEPVGNLDGLEADGEGTWLVTDWMAGGLYRIDVDGNAELLMDLNQGSADLGVINSEAIVLMPMMMDNTVIAISTR